MLLFPCAAFKSADLRIWRCSPCRKFKNIRSESDSVFDQGKKLSLKPGILLLFYLSIKSLTNISISQLVGLYQNTVSEWIIILHTWVADWVMRNSSPIGGPGVIVEADEAKFGKRKYQKGAYRNGMCVFDAVDRNTGECILLKY